MTMMAAPDAGADGPVGGGATTPPQGATLPARAPGAPQPGSVLPSHYSLCIGCGSNHPCGLNLRVSAGEGLNVVGSCTVTQHHQGAPGLAHGGMLVTVLDEVMGSLNWLLLAPAVTGRLEVDFRQPVPVGETLRLRAWITGVSGRKVYCAATGWLAGPGEPVVAATGLFLQVPLEHFARHGTAVQRSEDDPQQPWLEINP